MADRKDRFGDKVQAVIGWIALGVTLFSAILLGANRPVSWLGLSMIVLILFSCQLLVDLTDRRARKNVAHLWLPALLMLIVLSWGLVQTSFFATSILTSGSALFVPFSAEGGQIGLAHPAWLAIDKPGTISADPIAGHHTILKMTAYIALFWLALRAGSKRARATAMINVIGIFIALLSAYGIFAYASGTNFILGETSSTLSASFVNRNSFATYAAFGVVVNLAILLQIHGGQTGETGDRALRRFLEAFFGGGWLFALAFVTCATALAASQSRGGALALAVGLVVMLAVNHAKTQEGGRPTLILVAIAVVFVVATSATGLLSRFVATGDEETRFVIYGRIVDAIGLRPFIGQGLGSFEDAFRQFVPLSAASGEWDKAHNTYLELLFELGIPAAILFYLAISLVALQVFKGFFRRQRYFTVPLVGIGCITAAGIHSIFDFSLQIPAIGALFAFIVGMAWIQSFSENSGAD